MGRRNYLIEGLSGTGKTSVCDEFRRRGLQVVHGDRELAYQGDPETGEPLPGQIHEHHIWNVDRVRDLASSRDAALTFFCGGSRNVERFLDVFDGVFVLTVDLETLFRRLDSRPDTEWAGGEPTDRERIARWHATGEDVPRGAVAVDATMPIAAVVDAILDGIPGSRPPTSCDVSPTSPRGADR